MPLNLTLLQGLPLALRDQLEDFVNQLGAYLEVEHRDDGTHARVTGPGAVLKGGYATFHGQLRCRVGVAAGGWVVPSSVAAPIRWELPVQSDVTVNGGFYDNGRLEAGGAVYHGPADGWFLPPVPGNYLFLASCLWPPDGGGTTRQLWLQQGGQVLHRSAAAPSTLSYVSNLTTALVTFPDHQLPQEGALVRMPVQVFVYQDSGASVALVHPSEDTHCVVVKLS